MSNAYLSPAMRAALNAIKAAGKADFSPQIIGGSCWWASDTRIDTRTMRALYRRGFIHQADKTVATVTLVEGTWHG